METGSGEAQNEKVQGSKPGERERATEGRVIRVTSEQSSDGNFLLLTRNNYLLCLGLIFSLSHTSETSVWPRKKSLCGRPWGRGPEGEGQC